MDFRFECQPDCSNCCQVEGQVYLTEADLPRIAAFLSISTEDFENRYVYRTARQLRLRKPPDRQCHFHRDNRCAIHPVKPTQCRTFPFWPELIENEDAWMEAARYCPGMGKGELVQIEAATAIAGEMYRDYPQMYPERA
jgi:Fe-S-cluster containining protein